MFFSIPFVILSMEDEDNRLFMTNLFLKYERLMMSEIRKIVKDQCDPEDVLQISLVKLIEKVTLLRSLDERPRVNYIITTVKHTAISEVQKLRPGRFSSMDDEEWLEGHHLHVEGSVEESVFRRDNVSRMEAVWPLLDSKSQFLLRARYFLGMTTEEIARELNIKPDSVRMEMSRARKRVRDLLAEHFGMVNLWS